MTERTQEFWECEMELLGKNEINLKILTFFEIKTLNYQGSSYFKQHRIFRNTIASNYFKPCCFDTYS